MRQLVSTGKGTWGSSARAHPPLRGEVWEVVGTGIVARPDIPYTMPGDFERIAEAEAWIEANCVGLTRSTLFGSFAFKEFDDAVAFKLRFNGHIVKKNLE